MLSITVERPTRIGPVEELEALNSEADVLETSLLAVGDASLAGALP